MLTPKPPRHPGFEQLVECPQEVLPELAGRRMFLLQFNDVEPADVEVIRQGLIQRLKYEHTLFLPLVLARISKDTDARKSTRAWSLTADAEENITVYPTRTASDGLRKFYLPLPLAA